ncbi:MAG: FAD-dependent thymidylate synthase [Candidatus Altarchaeum sp.]|nr:FAD-dependent thymidylate synthase [Candidatus Altarchaeum sp.]
MSEKSEEEISVRIIKPTVWNFEVVNGKEAFKEVVYSARISGVPDVVDDAQVFSMMVENDYGSALEHIIIKFDLKMSKGNAPEFLEHRLVSHSGYSTRYIEVSKGIDKDSEGYEVIVPLHLLSDEYKDKTMKIITENLRAAISAYRKINKEGVPREIARYVLPFAIATGTYHVTINLRSLLNFLGLRLCVRTAPEIRSIASQIYFALTEKLPQLKGLIGCRGFMRGCCPESNVTGVRTGKQIKSYPVCIFKFTESEIYIPTIKEMRNNEKIIKFDKEKVVKSQEILFKKWVEWE